MSSYDYVVADVFTETPLQGNPVAVFTDARELSSEQMQRTARELNLSETVFVLPPADSAADARVRIFTPTTELPFAGHPLLGTAFVLAERDQIRLETRAGVISLELTADRTYGEMEQPLPQLEPFEAQDQLLKALGVSGSELPIEAYRNGPLHVYVNLAAVSELQPDMAALGRLGAVGVNCFALAGPAQVKTRMFGPGLGVPEDPATGSAAGPLALHLARHGRLNSGERLKIHQGEEIGRPSVLFARVEGSPEDPERIIVGGSAVIVARGSYRLK